MIKSPRLNCYIDAWNKHASGEAKWMCCTKSPWNKLGRFIAPIRWLGQMIIWPAAGFWLIGYFLQFGTWPHWIYCTRIRGDCMEYIPRVAKTPHFFPPILFEGDRRKVKDRRRYGRRQSD